MKILALNTGSSSIKYRVFDSSRNYQVLKQGSAERIQNDFRTAMDSLFPKGSKDLDEIDAVGHRVVHGGEQFKGPTLINKEVVDEIIGLAEFSPLHCQPNIIGIQVLHELLPDIPHVAVFDTTAHATMGPKAYLYAIPIEYYEKYRIRKYGFHGINHSYVAREAARILKKPLEELKVITCHLGNGCSVTAFEIGKSIDTSMGLTPLEGLVMGTRCGDIDPSVITYLIEERGIKPEQITDLLNKESGLLGLCGKSDMRDIIAMSSSGNKAAQTAIDIFVYRIQKYIGAYIATLNGVDAIIFTGGIGENSPLIRMLVAKNFSYLGVSVEAEKNEKKAVIFSTENSPVILMNIPANEEQEIAQQTYELVRS